MPEFAPVPYQNLLPELTSSIYELPVQTASSEAAALEPLPDLDPLQQERLETFVRLVSLVDEHTAKKDNGEQWNVNMYTYDEHGERTGTYNVQTGVTEATVASLQPITWETIEAWKQTANGLYEGFAQRSSALKRHADHFLAKREQQRAENQQQELEQLTRMWENGPTNI